MPEIIRSTPRMSAWLLIASSFLMCGPCHADMEDAAKTAACQAASSTASAPLIAESKAAVQSGNKEAAARAGCMAVKSGTLACLQAIQAPPETIRREALIQCP